ncbi:MAG: DUF177 domain-containing protein [Clostridia bacterium]|nr:DUF177 domain-containing protein [Clostridia bacterium]
MKLDLRSLLAGEIRTLPVDFTLAVDKGLTADPQSPLYAVRFCGPVAACGEVVNNAGYIRLSLTLSSQYVAPCARCLTDVPGEFSLSVERTVVTPKMAEDMDERDDDFIVTEDGFLDADALLTELFEMNFPSKVLCREDCRGLCQRCGADLNVAPCSCSGKTPDPRLAALGPLLEKLRAEEAAAPKDDSKN